MPHSVSAKKRVRQNATRRLCNKSIRSEIRTYTKRLEVAVEAKDKALAETCFKEAVSKLDKSLKKGVYHRNTVARKKSHCGKLFATL